MAPQLTGSLATKFSRSCTCGYREPSFTARGQSITVVVRPRECALLKARRSRGAAERALRTEHPQASGSLSSADVVVSTKRGARSSWTRRSLPPWRTVRRKGPRGPSGAEPGKKCEQQQHRADAHGKSERRTGWRALRGYDRYVNTRRDPGDPGSAHVTCSGPRWTPSRPRSSAAGGHCPDRTLRHRQPALPSSGSVITTGSVRYRSQVAALSMASAVSRWAHARGLEDARLSNASTSAWDTSSAAPPPATRQPAVSGKSAPGAADRRPPAPYRWQRGRQSLRLNSSTGPFSHGHKEASGLAAPAADLVRLGRARAIVAGGADDLSGGSSPCTLVRRAVARQVQP
jgi:hypothetical protein